MKLRIIIMLVLAVMLMNGCGKEEENKASGLTDTQNGVSSNIEVEVGQ